MFYDSSEALYLDLQNGRTDMIMTNPMKAHLKFLSKEDGAGFEFVSPAIDEVEFFGIGVGIGLLKDQPELLGRLDEAVKNTDKQRLTGGICAKVFPIPYS